MDGLLFVFSAYDAARLHTKSRLWLETRLEQHFDGQTVVITHHAPHRLSIHPRYSGRLLNAAFVSDMSRFFENVDLWIHGHMHDSFDYKIDNTRVIATPRGYAMNRLDAEFPSMLQWENEAFDPSLVVDVG